MFIRCRAARCIRRGPSEPEVEMDAPHGSPRHGHRLLQVGALLFFLALIVGLALPRFALPRLALSAHLLGLMQGTFLIAIGMLWPRLALSRSLSRIGAVLAVYGCGAAWTANLLGALWGAGGSMVPMATGGVRGTALQEGAIKVLLITGALSLVLTALVILWGLRAAPPQEPST